MFKATGAVLLAMQEIPRARRNDGERNGRHDQGRQERSPRWLDDLHFDCRLRLGCDAHLQRIYPYRPFDVLELGRAEIGDLHIEPAAHLAVGVFGKTYRFRLGDEPLRIPSAAAALWRRWASRRL